MDVGAKAEIHRLMGELAGGGLAVLVISSELPEVLGMADRVLVMGEGRITGEIGARRRRRGAHHARRAPGWAQAAMSANGHGAVAPAPRGSPGWARAA